MSGAGGGNGRRLRTMAVEIEVKDIAHTDVDDAEEALVAFLELALVEDLNCNNRILCDIAAVSWCVSQRTGAESDLNRTHMSKFSFQ